MLRPLGAVAVQVFALVGLTAPAYGQAPAAATAGTPDDTPSIRVGVTLFADYTMTQEPKIVDADGNAVTSNAFNIARSYINVTGRISRRIGFRVTPDVAREAGAGSSLNGSYTFRLKYAYAQFNFDQWLGGESWARFGMQQTPWVDFIDNVYRYRFQGTTLEDREGLLASSDVGATFHYEFSGDYGDVHGGIYNGDNYNRPEANDQKAFMVRATVRPLPRHSRLSGLRITGFYDLDAYVEDAERRRGIVGATYEHPYVNAAVNYVAATDRTRAADPKLNGHGFSIWATPKTSKGFGWEGLLRFDHLVQEQSTSVADGTRDRTIAGIAYWFPRHGNVVAALLLDYEWVENRNYVPARDDERRLALHALINF
jgi:hypothetical protein